MWAIGGLTNLGFAGAHCHKFPCHQGALGDRSVACCCSYLRSSQKACQLPYVIMIYCYKLSSYAFGFNLRIFCPYQILAHGKDADRATVTFADHSVREALLVGAEPDCYLAEVIIPRYPRFFFYVWCKHVAFANLCLVCVFLVRFCSLASCLG